MFRRAPCICLQSPDSLLIFFATSPILAKASGKFYQFYIYNLAFYWKSIPDLFSKRFPQIEDDLKSRHTIPMLFGNNIEVCGGWLWWRMLASHYNDFLSTGEQCKLQYEPGAAVKNQ